MSGRRRRPVLRLAGIVLIALGLSIGGLAAWHLWGTGIVTARAQEEMREALAVDTRQRGKAEGLPARGAFRPGEAIAIIRIPKIGLDMAIAEGADPDSLKRGPGRYLGTAYPWDERGRVGIAGHRTTYGRPFWSLDALAPGDRIIMETPFGRFRYLVDRLYVTHPGDVSVLEQTDRPTLVLTTCEPRFSAAKRLIVVAERVGPTA
jgi:LPXTG-site transpeptidase (sortase) family protein